MTGRLLPAGQYGFDDLLVGDRIETAEAEISIRMIDHFAELTGDRFRIHMEDADARSMGFPGRVAHGLLVLSVVDGLKNQTAAQFRAIASLGWDWAFRKPVIAGDRIRASIILRSKRLTTDGTRGILTLSVDVLNQRAELVQSGRNLLMVQR
jgi:acyl dehydratase